MRVLLVENHARYVKALGATLKTDGISVELASTGEDALDLLRHYEFDLVLLSLFMPDMEGSTLIARIRSAGHETPILALSNLQQARVRALSAGADDVVEHDIDHAELVARIRAIVRRTRGYSKPMLQIGALTLHVDSHEISANGHHVHLTGKEFALLQLMVLRRNMILTKETILTNLYGGMDEPELKIIDVFVYKLRNKLAKAGLSNVIRTVWGRGYTIRDNNTEGDTVQPPRVKQPARPEKELAFA